MVWALGLAATQSAGLREMFGSMGKAFHPGRSAQNGYAAALLAQAGFTSGERGIEGPRGFAHVMAASRDLSKITTRLGVDFDLRENTYKPFPCGIVNHPTIDGAIQIHDEHRPDPASIVAVRLRVAPLVLDLCNQQNITKGLQGKFSVYHGAAVGLVRGKGGLREYTDEAVNDPAIKRVRELTTAVGDPIDHRRSGAHRSRAEGRPSPDEVRRTVARQHPSSADRQAARGEVPRSGRARPAGQRGRVAHSTVLANRSTRRCRRVGGRDRPGRGVCRVTVRHSVLVVVALAIGCGRNPWPNPPAVEQTKYAADHRAWRDTQQGLVSDVLSIVGVWPLQEGETAFGSDATLPIVLPLSGKPDRAGVFRREGAAVTVVPAPGAAIRLSDGRPVRETLSLDQDIWIDSLLLYVADAGDDRRWVTARDMKHPAIANPPALETYPLDARWRVSARFDAFQSPKPVQVPDVRGGSMNFLSLGQLVFRLNEQEHRLTAFGEPGGGEFFVMFKDPTNLTTTYGGYRILTPAVVNSGEWTVLDFNFAFNPPCAYSRYTLCPLPPPENKLAVAVEAGLKRLPSAQGYSPS